MQNNINQLKPSDRSKPLTSTVETIHKIRTFVLMVGLAVVLVAFAARSRIFGKDLGEFVLKAEDCRSGQALGTTGGSILSIGGICTKACSDDTDCGDGLRCRESLCVPLGKAELGDPCEYPWDCKSFACAALMAIPFGGLPQLPKHSTCVQACDNTKTCPSDYDCIPSQDGSFCFRHQDGTSVLDLLQKMANPEDTAANP